MNQSHTGIAATERARGHSVARRGTSARSATSRRYAIAGRGLTARSAAGLLIAMGLVLAMWLATPASVRAAEPTLTEPTVTEYTAGLTPGGGPNAMTRGPDGAMWFSEYDGGKLGRIAADGTIAEYPPAGRTQLTSGAHPSGVVAGPDGNIWFSEFGSGDIGELDPATGELLGEYETPSGAASGPDGITRGPDGALWFAEQGEGLVGRIDPGTHEITEYLIHQHANAGYKPSSIVTGPDGALWITLTGLGEIARLEPAAAQAGTDKGVTLYQLPSGAGSEPEGIAVGPEGDLYVAEFGADKVARVIPASVSPGTSEGITEFAAKGQPLLVSAASDGAVWFTEPANDQLLRFDPKTATSTVVGSANGVTGDATGVAEDGAGHLWFTQFKTAAIGVLQLAALPSEVTQEPGPGGGGGAGGASGNGGASGTGGGPAPTVSLSTKATKGALAFDASASVPAGTTITGYSITLSGAGAAPPLNCGPSSPVVIPKFSKATSGTATLTVTTSSGARPVASTSFTAAPVPGLSPSRSARKSSIPTSTPDLIAYQCEPAEGSAAGANAPGAAPGVNIDTSCEVTGGIVQVEGCGLKYESDLCTGVPAPERALVEARMAPGRLAALVHPCGAVNRAALAANARAHIASLASRIGADESLIRSEFDAYYVSTEPVRVNGLDIVPQNGSAIVLAVGGLIGTSFTNKYSVYLISTDASVDIGGYGLAAGKRLDLDVSNVGAAQAQVASFQIKSPVTLGRVAQLAADIAFQADGGVPTLPITGGFTATFVAGGMTQLAFNLQMNKLFSNPLDDAPFTGSSMFTTSNSTGPTLEELNINIPEINFGDVGALSPVKLHWVARTNFISGSFGLDIDAIGGSVGGTLEFQGGVFKDGSVEYQADEGKGFQLVGPVYLIGLNAGFSLYQSQIPGSATTFSGGAIFSVGPAISNNSCGVLDVDGSALINFYPGPFSITTNAETRLFCIPLKDSYFTVNSEGYVELGSSFDYEIPDVGSYQGNEDGQAYSDPDNPIDIHFQLDGSDSATLNGIGTVAVSTVLSDRGLGACADIDAFGVHWHPGIGESFSPLPISPEQFLHNLTLFFDGCSLSSYQSLGTGGPPAGAAEASAGAASYSFSIPAGEQTAVVALRGQGGAPTVTLTGPGGRTIDTAVNAATKTQLVLRQDSSATTVVEIRGVKTGQWTIAPDPGSVPLAGAYTAQELPAPKITARVSGRGARRVLHYRIAPQPGMQVAFVEAGKDGGEQLGAARGTRGALPFVPSDAVRGTRTITAVLTQNGMPRPGLVVAHYLAAPPRPGRVSAITARRVAGGVRVAFRAAPLAQRYLVSMILSDGRELLLATAPHSTSLRIPNVAAGVAIVRLGVIALRNEQRGPTTFAKTRRGRRSPRRHR
jgi:streptogramin lyase